MISAVVITGFITAFILANIDLVLEFFDVVLQFPKTLQVMYDSVSPIQGILGDVIYFGYMAFSIAILAFIIRKIRDIMEGSII